MKLVQIAKIVLSDVKQLLETIDRDAYKEEIFILSSSTIGQHSRHLIEFFECLLQQAQEGTVCYDKRKRNLQIETDPIFAVEQIEKLNLQLSSIRKDFELNLEVDYSLTGNEKLHIPSSFERELMYNIDHAIHHMALIKVGLKVVAPELKLPEGFGINPSTLRFAKANSR